MAKKKAPEDTKNWDDVLASAEAGELDEGEPLTDAELAELDAQVEADEKAERERREDAEPVVTDPVYAPVAPVLDPDVSPPAGDPPVVTPVPLTADEKADIARIAAENAAKDADALALRALQDSRENDPFVEDAKGKQRVVEQKLAEQNAAWDRGLVAPEVTRPVTEPVVLTEEEKADIRRIAEENAAKNILPQEPLGRDHDPWVEDAKGKQRVADQKIAEKDAKDNPVSNSAEPINLLDPGPEPLERVTVGNVDIIASKDHIEVLERGGIRDSGKTPEPPPPVPMNPQMIEKLSAEQAAGRATLERNAAHKATVPRAVPTEKEIKAQATTTEVFRPGSLVQQHLLNKPVVPGKGPGY